MARDKNEIIRSGIEKYCFLRKQLVETDVSINPDFQRLFNGFFRMGRRSKEYYSDYFCYLQQHKDRGISFADALTFFYEKYGRLEMSFVSKMVALVDPMRPIWDSVVTKGHFGIVVPYTKTGSRLQLGIEKYELYCNCYNAYMLTKEAKEKIIWFNKLYPGTDITDTKKLDFILWQER